MSHFVPTSFLRSFGLPFVLVSSILSFGCGDDDTTGLCTVESDCLAGQSCIDGVCVSPNDDAGRLDSGLRDGGGMDLSTITLLASLEVTPVAAEAVVRNGETEPVVFEAVGVRDDGSRDTSLRVMWSLDSATLGSISNTGAFVANGQAGGAVLVSASVMTTDGELRAEAMLNVRIENSHVDETVAAETVSAIEMAAPTDAAAPRLVYPLDNVVMPQNVFAPDIQWTPEGVAMDVFRIRLSKPTVQITAYVAPASRDTALHHWLPSPADWRALTDSDLTSPITLAIDRWNADADELSSGETRTLNLSQGALSGALYYWSVQQGKVMRLNPAAAEPEEMNLAGGACVACHSVSRDGRYLAASIENDLIGGVFDLTTADSPTTFAAGPNRRFAFSTFNPDATRLLVNHYVTEGAGWRDTISLALIDPQTGVQVPATGLPGAGLSMAEWSPDGNSVAVISNVVSEFNAAYIFENGDLGVMPANAGDTFGPIVPLHTGASLTSAPEGGSSDMHPSWSPDSTLLAFAHGTRGRATSGGTRIVEYFPGALYLTGRAGGEVFRLNEANGGAGGAQSYWPTFSPFVTLTPDASGRYYWLAYFTPRNYGNLRPTSPPPSQIWVTAIDTAPVSGSDPSHVPYWLPGQDRRQHNIDAHWTAQACRVNGSGCASSSECCSGVCLSPEDGLPAVCTPPPATSCRTEGTSCGGAADCCTGLVCIANSCVQDLR